MKIATKVQGLTRYIWLDGDKYSITADAQPVFHRDRYHYTLPNGVTYSHPTEFGALLMILKHHAGGEWHEPPSIEL